MKKFLSCAVIALAILLCGCSSTSGGGSTSVYVPTYDGIVSKSQPNNKSTVSDNVTTSSEDSMSSSYKYIDIDDIFNYIEPLESESGSSSNGSSSGGSSSGSVSSRDWFNSSKTLSSKVELEPVVSTAPVKNGYVICPECTYVHIESDECPVCNRDPNVGGPYVTQHCPTCGGGFAVTDVRPWVKCGYCDDYFVSCDDPVFDCKNCKRKNLKGSEMWKIDQTICAECGNTIGGYELN